MHQLWTKTLLLLLLQPTATQMVKVYWEVWMQKYIIIILLYFIILLLLGILLFNSLCFAFGNGGCSGWISSSYPLTLPHHPMSLRCCAQDRTTIAFNNQYYEWFLTAWLLRNLTFFVFFSWTLFNVLYRILNNTVISLNRTKF